MISDAQLVGTQTAPFTLDDDLLVSFLLYSYEASDLERCLLSIFEQRHISNFEVIICDDASHDGAWQIANRYARLHDGVITISRNSKCLGKEANRQKGLKMCKGDFGVELTSDALFDPAYVAHTIDRLRSDKFLKHHFIFQKRPDNIFIPTPTNRKKFAEHKRMPVPLVTVCIYNFNYGRYLRQCIDSVIAQSYERLEICFSDNASTDDSWEIALHYAERYPAKISLTRNRINFGPSVNLANCTLNMRGKYVLKLCSDDAIHPEFIQRCVAALEKHPEAAFAMVHRDIIDEEGRVTKEPPFYNQSCLIDGAEQAAVYMMSSVNASISQILYNLERAEAKRMAGNLNDRWFGDRLMDYHICCDSSVVYLSEPLLLNRVHGQSDGARMSGNLLQCMGEYVLLHQLADIAEGHQHMERARGRLQPGIEKLGRLCLRYCLRGLIGADEQAALRYFHLAIAVFPEVRADETFARLSRYWSSTPQEQRELVQQLAAEANLVTRAVSYPPPPGSIPL